ncbi:MAG: DUF2232 domain-containing protein [Nanoarchaeota archaeon]|nr:DUF2232 domain-containing protein [Nanoarchaeota archaeon]
MVFDGFLNSILGGFISWNPLLALIIISFILMLITTLIYKYFTDQEAMKHLKEEMKEIQEEMKKAKDDAGKMMELQKQSFSKMIESFKHQLKPMLITFVPFIILFPWLRGIYTPMGDLFLGMGWFGNYLIFGIVFNIILRKILKVH